MTDEADWPTKAYENRRFLKSRPARELRILSEYIEPETRFEEFQVRDTVVFFGSARIKSREEAQVHLAQAGKDGGDVATAERDLNMSQYYEDARQLAFRLTQWSKNLEPSPPYTL